jgi:superfamily II DNA or RNA helicase
LAAVAEAMHACYRRILVQLLTGGGKTHEIAAIVAAAVLAGLRVLVLATRTRLVRQLHERLEGFGVTHGVIAAPLPELRDYACTVQVASADTLHRRCIADKRMPLPAADVVIFDEAHLAGADSRLAILESYPAAVRIGFTATPARKSGRGLGHVFDALIPGPSILELIAAGMLVRPRIFNTPLVSQAELEAVPKDSANDYQPRALGALLSRPKLVGDVVQNWLRIAAGKRSIAFACNKAHGAQLTQEFTQAGIAAELLTDSDAESTREEVYARLEAGRTTVLVNVFLAAYGIDLPTVECIVLARPTRSVVMYLQMVGRGMRPAPGKADFLLIDHGRVVDTLGLPHAPREWTLDERRNVNTEARERFTRKATEEKPRTCPECQHLWLVSQDGEACRECGWVPAPRPLSVTVQAAELGELVEAERQLLMPHAPEVAQFYREAVAWYGARWPDRWRERPKSGRWWAWSQARAKFRFDEQTPMPREFWETPPSRTSVATAGWLKSQLIRYAKRRRAA